MMFGSKHKCKTDQNRPYARRIVVLRIKRTMYLSGQSAENLTARENRTFRFNRDVLLGGLSFAFEFKFLEVWRFKRIFWST